jgi:hypothetical protein
MLVYTSSRISILASRFLSNPLLHFPSFVFLLSSFFLDISHLTYRLYVTMEVGMLVSACDLHWRSRVKNWCREKKAVEISRKCAIMARLRPTVPHTAQPAPCPQRHRSCTRHLTHNMLSQPAQRPMSDDR